MCFYAPERNSEGNSDRRAYGHAKRNVAECGSKGCTDSTTKADAQCKVVAEALPILICVAHLISFLGQ
jgi:hypothetical protein